MSGKQLESTSESRLCAQQCTRDETTDELCRTKHRVWSVTVTLLEARERLLSGKAKWQCQIA